MSVCVVEACERPGVSEASVGERIEYSSSEELELEPELEEFRDESEELLERQVAMLCLKRRFFNWENKE